MAVGLCAAHSHEDVAFLYAARIYFDAGYFPFLSPEYLSGLCGLCELLYCHYFRFIVMVLPLLTLVPAGRLCS